MAKKMLQKATKKTKTKTAVKAFTKAATPQAIHRSLSVNQHVSGASACADATKRCLRGVVLCVHMPARPHACTTACTHMHIHTHARTHARSLARMHARTHTSMHMHACICCVELLVAPFCFELHQSNGVFPWQGAASVLKPLRARASVLRVSDSSRASSLKLRNKALHMQVSTNICFATLNPARRIRNAALSLASCCVHCWSSGRRPTVHTSTMVRSVSCTSSLSR